MSETSNERALGTGAEGDLNDPGSPFGDIPNARLGEQPSEHNVNQAAAPAPVYIQEENV